MDHYTKSIMISAKSNHEIINHNSDYAVDWNISYLVAIDAIIGNKCSDPKFEIEIQIATKNELFKKLIPSAASKFRFLERRESWTEIFVCHFLRDFGRKRQKLSIKMNVFKQWFMVIISVFSYLLGHTIKKKMANVVR